MYSWPGVKPLLNGSSPSTIAGRPCLMISISVAQTAIASIRTSTSAGPGSGTGFSTSDSSSGSPSTQAFIVFGTGTRCCGALRVMLAAAILCLCDACRAFSENSLAAASGYWSSQTSVRSWPMKWLGVMLQPLSFAEVATIRFHHNSGTV